MLYKKKGLETKKILLVEDVELNQFLARHIMESWGCIVEIAENGKLAIEKLLSAEFDLVLMDIQMPVMDGIEATRHIRSIPDKKKAVVPIVALTANASRGECNVYVQMGMNDCLPKPFEEAALFEIVSKNIKTEQAKTMDTTVIVAPVASIEKKYDLSLIEAISGGDQSFIHKMLNLFLDTVPGSLEDMQAATDKNDWLQLSRLAHKLKSTIDSMGISELKEDIRTIEACGKKTESIVGLQELLSKVVSEMEIVMAEVKKDYSL